MDTTTNTNHFLNAVFPKDLFLDCLEITAAVFASCGGPKTSPVHRYSIVIFTLSCPLGLQCSTHLPLSLMNRQHNQTEYAVFKL